MYWVLCHHYSMIHTVQPKHSLLSVKRLQRHSQTALGGWMGGGQGKREKDSCSLVGNDFFSLPHNMKPQSIPTSRALDPEYSRWWHFTMCRRWGFAEIGESVWSIDHCCCCPCLLYVSQCQLTLRERDADTETRLVLQGTPIQQGWAGCKQDSEAEI